MISLFFMFVFIYFAVGIIPAGVMVLQELASAGGGRDRLLVTIFIVKTWTLWPLYLGRIIRKANS